MMTVVFAEHTRTRSPISKSTTAFRATACAIGASLGGVEVARPSAKGKTMKLTALLLAAQVTVTPPATLVLEKIRSVDDPRVFDLRDATTGDRGVMPACTLSDKTAVTLISKKDATLEIVREGVKRTLVIENVSGLARATLACGDTDDFYYANPRLGTLYAYSADRLFRGEDPVVWKRSVTPFTSMDAAGGILTDSSIATVVEARQRLVLLEWFFRKNGATGFWHEVFDAATGASLGKLGPSDLLMKTNEHDPWWVLLQGGGNETANYVPSSVFRLKYESPGEGGKPAVEAIVELKTHAPAPRFKAIARPSKNPVTNHMIALLSPTRTTMTPRIDFCPTVPGQRARYWLGSDYDDMLATLARNILLAFWAERQIAGATVNPIDAWFSENIAPNEPMKTLLTHFNPQDDEWVAAYQEALFKLGEPTFDYLVSKYGIATGAIVRTPDKKDVP